MQSTVSIILPIRNEAKFIENCLGSIISQDLPLDSIEVLLIDGNSTDNTKEAASNYLKNSPQAKDLKHWEVIDNPQKTAPYGMNIGINKAKGDYILILSGHSTIAPDYLAQCIKTINDKEADNVGGPAIPIDLKDDSISRAINMAHLSPFGLGGGSFRLGNYEGYVDTVYLGFYKKETFAKYGRYDTRLTRNQDIELNARIRKGIRSGNDGYAVDIRTGNDGVSMASQPYDNSKAPEPGKIYLTPKIKSYYYCRNTLRGLWSQNFRNGQWVVYTKYIAPYALSLRHFIPLLFVGSLLGLAILCLAPAYSVQTPPFHFAQQNKIRLSAGSPRSGEGLFGLGTVCLLLLVVELGAYFGAMLMAVIQAGKTQLCNGHSKDKAAKGGGDTMDKRSSYTGDTMGMPSANNCMSTESPSCVNGMSTVPPSHSNIMTSLLLLPIVFMTLHFSYGLGSIWGLISLPYWAGTNRTRI